MRTLRAFVLTFALTLTLAAQSLSPIFNTQDQVQFNAAYKASLPPDLIAFMALPYNASDFGISATTLITRTTPSVLLPIAGKYKLDTQIMLWGWDPYITDLIRIVQGYAWVPSFGQANIAVGPGISPALVAAAGTAAYDPASPPAGSILMPVVDASGKMALPLPYSPPVLILPPITTDPVGFLEMPFGAPGGTGDWYSVLTGDKSPVGTVSSDTRGTFQKQYEGFANVADPGVVSVFWVKQ
jgi:hypothetical protein